MKENEEQVLTWLFKAEGGFIESPSEPGGASNFGIAMVTLSDWRGLKKLEKPSILDLKHMSRDEATEIYRYKYLNPIRFDELPSGVDYCVFDAAVQHGCSGSIRLLQESLGFKDEEDYPDWTGHVITGDLDPSTMWAVKIRKPDILIREFMYVRAHRHKKILEFKNTKIPDFSKKWSPIWDRRRAKVLERSLSLVGVK